MELAWHNQVTKGTVGISKHDWMWSWSHRLGHVCRAFLSSQLTPPQLLSRDSSKPNELVTVSLRVVRRIHFYKTVQARWQLPDFVDRSTFTSRHARRTTNTSPGVNEELPGVSKARLIGRRMDGFAQAYW